MKKILPEQVWTTEQCFRQRVNLPAAQVDGLSPDELQAALSFEIEPFSGIPRAESAMAWKRTGDGTGSRRVFDVVQIRRSELVRAVAEARRAKRTIRAVTAVPDAALGETVEALPWIEMRAAGGLRTVKMPVLWGIVCVVIAIALAWDAWTLTAETAELRRDMAVRRPLQMQKDALNAQLAKIEQETRNLRQRRVDEANAQQNVEVLRNAWRTLLDALPEACRDEAVVKELVPVGAFAVELRGMGLSAEAATRTLVRLTSALKARRSLWQVTPGAIGANAGGGTVSFTGEHVFDPNGQFK